jgi:SAM-dependent methyltransferase
VFRTVKPGNYPTQALTYDRTRGASPTLIRVLGKYLGDGGGRSALDIAGGTGNYSLFTEARGFKPVMVDLEPAMLGVARGKLAAGRFVVGDSARLPLRDASVDVAMLISALHLMADKPAALAEARRVIREGPFLLQVFTKENMIPLFVFEYFNESDPPPDMHQTADETESMLLTAGFSTAEREPFVYADTADGTLAALHTDALALGGPAYLRNTSYWHRLDEETRRVGLERLGADLRSGRLEERIQESLRLAARHGHGTIFVGRP